MLLVRPEALDGAKPRAVFGDLGARFFGDLLIGDRLDEFPHPESAGVARGALGGQRVIGADDFVAEGHVRFRPEEHRAVIFHVIQEVARVASENFDVLVGEAVRFARGFLEVAHQNDLPVVAPGDRRDIRGGQAL